MSKVSREASTSVGSGNLGDESLAFRRPARIGDVLFGDGLGDGGVHGSSLSIESCSAIAIRMN
ncbi:MAG: hypothetical protein JO027_13300 [Solirubrobacterales bacterium]|nr:hypothetical protein [Solirubrobacterales bacterium]